MAEENKTEEKKEIRKQEEHPSEKPKDKKEEKKKSEEKIKRTEARVNGRDLGMSTKQAVAICRAIRGRKIEDAISKLEMVVKMKRAIPMKGELPHRKGNIMSGRYPIKASEIVISLLKSLAANASATGVNLDKAKITLAKPDKASRPLRRFGQTKFKRTHISLVVKEK